MGNYRGSRAALLSLRPTHGGDDTIVRWFDRSRPRRVEMCRVWNSDPVKLALGVLEG